MKRRREGGVRGAKEEEDNDVQHTYLLRQQQPARQSRPPAEGEPLPPEVVLGVKGHRRQVEGGLEAARKGRLLLSGRISGRGRVGAVEGSGGGGGCRGARVAIVHWTAVAVHSRCRRGDRGDVVVGVVSIAQMTSAPSAAPIAAIGQVVVTASAVASVAAVLEGRRGGGCRLGRCRRLCLRHTGGVLGVGGGDRSRRSAVHRGVGRRSEERHWAVLRPLVVGRRLMGQRGGRLHRLLALLPRVD
ncbi:hypothetical protein TYRP_007033 [Tyrophagus putrescentiae]|nr:hypothetical protein TYRP_007033 [Tyrophagus putrescentiae]